MTRFFYILTAIVAALVLGAVTLPLVVSEDAVRAEAAARIRALTGYDLAITGDTELDVFPLPRFRINDVMLSVPGDPEMTPLAVVDTLAGSLGLLPLLTGNVDIESFTLIRPHFNLEVDERGERNWLTDAGLVGTAIERPGSLPVRGIRLGTISIEDGSLSYSDARTGEGYRASAISTSLSWPNLGAALSGSGSLVWRGEIVDFSFVAETPLALLGQGSTPAQLTISSAVGNVSFTGNAHLRHNPQIEGRVTLKTATTRDFLRWLGADLGPGGGLNVLNLAGRLNLVHNTAALTNLKFTLDGNSAEGGITIDLSREVPGVQATLAFGNLDLNVYRELATDAAANGDDSGAPDDGALERPVELPDLDRLTADVRLSAASVAYGGLTLGQTAATVTVRDATLTLGIGQTQIHGGTGMGTLIATSTPHGVEARIAMTGERVQVGPFAAMLGAGGRISGTGATTLNLSGTGHTLGEILSRLSGNASFALSNGAIRGIDIVALIDAVGAGRFEGLPIGGSASTRFGNLTATFTVTSGTASTRDLQLTGPALSLAAEADIGLAAASITGRGTAELRTGTADTPAGFSMPFVVEGPLERPMVYPDPRWLLDRTAGSSDLMPDLGGHLPAVPDEIIDDVLQNGLDRLPELFHPR